MNNGKSFTTIDQDNDKFQGNCAQFRDFGLALIRLSFLSVILIDSSSTFNKLRFSLMDYNCPYPLYTNCTNHFLIFLWYILG